jgi:hypothetical protein
MTGLARYPKIWTLGHRQTNKLFAGGPVVIQEKIDGSQISFGIVDGTLMIRSRGVQLDLEAPDNLFDNAVAEIIAKHNLLLPNYIYRGEYLKKPKHNVIKYADIPKSHIMLFDVEITAPSIAPPAKAFLEPEGVAVECRHLGFDQVPTFTIEGTPETNLDELLDKESCLGGAKIEGLVLKNYNQFTDLGDPVFAKYVSPDFKEQHSEWKRKKRRKDMITDLATNYRTEARWEKAVQHLADKLMLKGTPQDIGELFKEVHLDFEEEEKEAVKEMLWDHFRKPILRGLTVGLAEWYKERLSEIQVESSSYSQQKQTTSNS